MKPFYSPGIKYYTIPIVFFRIDDDNILAQASGVDEELVGHDPEKLKLAFGDSIKTKKGFDFPELAECGLYILDLKIQPSHLEWMDYYPVNEYINLRVPLIYGLTQFETYDCYFPILKVWFHCKHKKQIKQFGKSFAIDILQRYQPSELYLQLFQSDPWLDTIRVEIKDIENNKFQQKNKWEKIELLNQLAEKYPHQKSIKKRIRIFPQTAWERKDAIEKAYSKIINEKVNLLLVGDSGVGKSAIINETIRRIDKFVKDAKPTFWRTNPRQITSGAKYLGEWQQICEQMMNELEYVDGILWIDDFLSLFSTGGSGVEDSIAAFLLPFINSGKVRIMAELTPRELEAARRIFPSFTGIFQTMRIDEMEKAKNMQIIRLFNDYTTKNYDITFENKALNLSYRLLNRFVPYEKFPGKAISFLSQLVSKAFDSNENSILQNDIITSFTEKTGMPEFIFNDEIQIDKDALTNYFTSKIIGQEDAIAKVTTVIKVYKTGLNNPNKPVSVMIFAGPTGVGKTATAKEMANYFFGHGQKTNPLIRLDMSEFQHPGQISRIMGSGASETGKLIQHVRENPFCIVLLDEIEKANPIIYDALMNVFDEGILVDNFGRTTDFRNAIIIMTTNLGSQSRQSIGLVKTGDQDYLKPIKNFFRPEFFNRIDHVVSFKPLNQETIREIATKEMQELGLREGFIKNNIKLKYSDEVEELIASVGFDKEYGARPLQRAIEREITAPIARFLLKNNTLSHCTLKLSLMDGKVRIAVA